ncbi:MAG TPA: sugar phosphate isomerase/epimerase family protein [Terriglobia bacterium]|nr:sugar phosphate isomerase/epimerase family protein [Terriglobia bacterium]
MGQFTRRRFLADSALLAASAAALGFARSPAPSPPEPHLSFPTAPRERLAVASYPFRKFIDSPFNLGRDHTEPGMDLEGFAAMVVKRFNVRGIELLNNHFASTDAAYLSQLRNAFEKAGVHVVNIPVDIHHSLYDPDAAKRQTAMDEAQKWVGVAVAVGSPSVRIHIEGVRGLAPDVGRAAESLRQVASYGAEKNIVVNLENDDLVSEDAFFVVKVIDAVNSPYLRALPDFCNSMLAGMPEFNYDALTLMFKHAYNISHMKDSEAGDSGKVYTIDVARTFAIAKAANYDGYFSMEWDRPGDPYKGTERLIEESLKHLA